MTRKFLIAALMLGGCQKLGMQPIADSPPDQLNPTPIMVDGAMERRTWDSSSAKYAKMEVVAGPTGFRWHEDYDYTGTQYKWAFLDTWMFVGNIGAMPYTYSQVRQWDQVRYRGITVEPTYTGNPPIPPSPTMTEAAAPVMESPAAEPATDLVPAPTTNPSGS